MKDFVQRLIEWLIPMLVGSVFMVGLAVWLKPEFGEKLSRLVDRIRTPKVVAENPAMNRPMQPTAEEGAVEPMPEPPPEPEFVIKRAVSLPSPLLKPIGSQLNQDWIASAVSAGLPMVLACLIQEDRERLWSELVEGADPNERSASGETALGWAMRNGHWDRFSDLVHWGADLEQLPQEGQPLLILAALRRQDEAMELLLALGVEVDARSRRPVDPALLDDVAVRDLQSALERDGGLTPLMISAARGDVDGVERLLSAGAARSVHTDRDKRYPINFAATQKYVYIMQLLLGRRPGEEMEQSVVIDKSTQSARILRGGEVFATTSVSTGKKGYETPEGTFVITNKHRDWTSNLYDASMPHFMRLNCGAIGLHAGHVPGYAASHGCIRLPSSKAREWFGYLRLGDVVQIIP